MRRTEVVFNSTAQGVGAAMDCTPVYERLTGTIFVFFTTASTAGTRTGWKLAQSTDG